MNKLIKIFVLLTCFFSLSILVSCACEHEFEESIIKEATCQYEGVKELKCRKCGYIELKQIDKISHSFQEEVLKDATCIETGIKVKTCTVCNHKEEVEIGKNDNHLFDEGVYDSEKDIFIFTCLNCSFVKEVNKEELYCEAHSFNEGKVIKEANCFEDGIMEYSCSKCLFKKTEVINKLNHNLVKVDGYDATCYDEGRKTFYHCIYCQNNYDEENNQLETVVINVLEHNYVTHDGFTMCEHCHEYDVLFISSINEENKISKRYDKDLKAVIEDNLLTEDNYSFVSWNSKKDGSGDSYQAGLEYDYLPNKLYAIYTDATSFEITFLDHEGNLITKETVKYNEMPTAPTLSFVKPTAEGKKEYVWNKELTKAVKNETYQAVLSDCVVLSVTEALERNSGEYIYVKGIVAGAGYKIIQAAVLLKDSENDNLINMVLMPGNTDNKNPKFVGFKIGDEFIIRCKVEVAKESTADKGDKYLSFADFGSTNSDYVVRENVNIEYDYSKALEITTQEELIKFVNSNPSESLDKIVKLSGTIYVNFYSGNLRLSLDGGDSATSYQVFSPTTATRKTYLFFRGTYGDFNTGTDFKELVLGISKDVDTADGIFPTGVFFGDLYFVILGADGYNRYATLLNASGAVRKVKYHQGTVEKVSIYDGKAPTLESLGITLEDGIIFKEWNTLADGTGASFKEGDDMNKYYQDLYAIVDGLSKDIEITFKDEKGNIVSTETYAMGETVQAPTFDNYKIEGNKYLVFNGFDSELTQATVSKVYCAVYNEYDIVDVKDRNENSDDIFFIRGLVLGANFQKNAELIIKDKETNNVVSINFGYSAILGTSSSPKLAGFKVGDEIILPVKNEPGIDALDKGKVRLQFNEKLIPDKEPSKFVASSNNDISFNNESILTVSNNEELKALVTTEGNSYTYFKLTGPISFTYATADNKDYKYATLMYKVFYEDASVKTLTNVKNIAGKYVQFRQVYTTLNRGKSFGEEVLGLSKSMSLPNGIDFNDTCYTYDKDIYCVFVGGNSYYELLLISID